MTPHERRSAPANQRSVRRHNLGVVLRARRRPRCALARGDRAGDRPEQDDGVEPRRRADRLRAGSRDRGRAARHGRPARAPGRAERRPGRGPRARDRRRLPRRPGGRPRPAPSATGRWSTGDNRGRPVDAVLDDAGGARRATRSTTLDAARPAHGRRGGGAAGAGRQRRPPAGRAQPRLDATSTCPTCCASGSARSRSRSAPRTRRTSARSPSCGRAPGAQLRDFIYISGELGVGAGIIVGGELFRGARGFGGELGHVTVDPGGDVCACGNRGCVETRVALGALLRAAGLDRRRAGSSELAERAEAGDARALDRARARPATGSASASPRRRTCSTRAGSSSAATSRRSRPGCRPALEEELDARVLSSEWDAPLVVTSALGGEAAVRGAAARLYGACTRTPGSSRSSRASARRAGPRPAAGRAPRWRSRARPARPAARTRPSGAAGSSPSADALGELGRRGRGERLLHLRQLVELGAPARASAR